MARLILVLLDGLRAAAADSHMGFMAALTEHGDARRLTLDCALPPLSRPLYATLIPSSMLRWYCFDSSIVFCKNFI